ncbi:MAG: hypothetical protein ACLQVD_20920 [Capsulimonadaceae bacterium]
MDTESIVKSLEYEWQEGFLWNLRDRKYDSDGAQRLQLLLNSVDLGESTCVDKRLVELLWFIYPFMGWQIEALQADGASESTLHHLRTVAEYVFDKMADLFGYP